jgi:hypothetical protein
MRDNYYDIKAISNSSLSWLKESPKVFQENMNNKADERESKSLKNGKIIHSFILEPDSFAVSDVEPVEGMMGRFIEELVKIELNGTIEEQERRYATAYTKAGFKLSIDVILKNLNKDDNQNFYKFLLNTNGKTCLSVVDYKMLTNIKNNLTQHKKATWLLFNDMFLKFKNTILIEETLEFEIDDIKCKAKPDKVIINHENKQVFLIDLKTTSKAINKFYESFQVYEYGRQLAFYKDALITKYGLENYDFACYIIAVQTVKYNEVAVFRITDKQLDKGKKQYLELFNLYKEHKKYGFEFPLDYYLSATGEVELKEEVDVYDNGESKTA